MRLPGHHGYAYPKSHQVSEGCHCTEAMCYSVVTRGELVGWPRPKRGAGLRVSGPKSVKILLHRLKNAE